MNNPFEHSSYLYLSVFNFNPLYMIRYFVDCIRCKQYWLCIYWCYISYSNEGHALQLGLSQPALHQTLLSIEPWTETLLTSNRGSKVFLLLKSRSVYSYWKLPELLAKNNFLPWLYLCLYRLAFQVTQNRKTCQKVIDPETLISQLIRFIQTHISLTHRSPVSHKNHR